MSVGRLLAACTVAAILFPSTTFAEGFLSLSGGGIAGGSLHEGRPTYGGSVGSLGEGMVGFEFEYFYTPKFNGEHANFQVNARTAGFDVLVAPGTGTWRPYGSAGLHLVGAVRTFKDVFKTGEETDNQVGWAVGAGVMGHVSEGFGLRADVQYLRSLKSPDHGLDSDDRLRFVRFGAGLVAWF